MRDAAGAVLDHLHAGRRDGRAMEPAAASLATVGRQVGATSIRRAPEPAGRTSESIARRERARPCQTQQALRGRSDRSVVRGVIRHMDTM
jgi:hypothetical protein